MQIKFDQLRDWNIQFARRFRRLKKKITIQQRILTLIRLYHIIGNAKKVGDVFR